MCQPQCKQPTSRLCSFYTDCAEATLKCGSGGCPIKYGLKNCLGFQGDLAKYTSAGQAFIWRTMNRLQVELRDAITCDSTCGQVNNAAFDSHPRCYIASGFFDLPVEDWYQLMKTVGWDLVGMQSFKQIIQTAGGCGGEMFEKIERGITESLEKAASDWVNAAQYLTRAAAMRILKKMIQGLLGHGGIL
ncbi:hypothetical protein QBC38DRAFT_487559 [Podospora fimiseda]|uniref:Uncharacterized protein n=1 Tax=Podospora fimiseda TaxID=252190 RepID=A0AAN7BHH9_9PEZI|nr:hypothetical protein QBC38DRAFT_487559 [Podospora fimiseda]